MSDTGIILAPADNGGCGFYRITQPGERYADLMGDVVGLVNPGENINPAVLKNVVRDMGIKFLLINRQFTDEQVAGWSAFKRLCPDTPLYMDFDDLLWKPHPRSDYKPTPQMIRNLDVVARLADRLICSTKPMQDALWYRYKKKARILPNMISEDEFKPLRSRGSEKLRIVWAGSSTHQCDLDQIVPVIQKTHDRYDWHFLGYAPPEIKDMVTFHAGVSREQYLGKLDSIQAHVGIAPLIDIGFNKCKSNVKLLEYGALGLATIANSVYPYNLSPCVKTGTGSERQWLDALSSLEDEKFRLDNAEKSQDYSLGFSITRNDDTILNAYN